MSLVPGYKRRGGLYFAEFMQNKVNCNASLKQVSRLFSACTSTTKLCGFQTKHITYANTYVFNMYLILKLVRLVTCKMFAEII